MSRKSIQLVICGVGLVSAALAQTTNATLVGDVTDTSSSVVPNATVTVTSKGTGIKRSVDSNETGAYRVFPLNPGTYDVSVSKSGFVRKQCKMSSWKSRVTSSSTSDWMWARLPKQ